MYWYLKCLRQYVDFKGRARRKEYWMFFLFNLIFGIVTSFIDVMIGWKVVSSLYSIAVFLPGLALFVRRLHDIGKSGWWFFVPFVFAFVGGLLGITVPNSIIPAVIVMIVGIVLPLYWACLDGEGGSNQWGPDPKAEEE